MSALILAALLGGAPVVADTVVGRWRTGTHDAIIEIARCGRSICGRLLTSDLLRREPGTRDSKNAEPALRARPLQGLQMLGDFTPAAGGVWENGHVYDPEDGRTYSGRITPLGADRIKLRGCVFFPLCKTQTWTRVR